MTEVVRGRSEQLRILAVPAGAKPAVVLQCSSSQVTVPRLKEGKKDSSSGWAVTYMITT